MRFVFNTTTCKFCKFIQLVIYLELLLVQNYSSETLLFWKVGKEDAFFPHVLHSLSMEGLCDILWDCSSARIRQN